MKRLVTLALLCSFAIPLRAADDFDEEINEGELNFLSTPPATAPHRHSKHIFISPESFKSGWIRGEQCHYRLDKVRAMEIVFGKGTVRALKVLSSQNIEKVWVEDNSVQLKNIGADAFLCIASENRILKPGTDKDTYLLSSGPYMRRFLDGYFPMHVELTVDYPQQIVRLKQISPSELQAQTKTSPGQVKIDTLFEGRLTIVLHFSRLTKQSALP